MPMSAEQRRKSMSPISKLYEDILSQIFLFNADFDFDYPHIPSHTTRHSSQVSRKWRDLILSYPRVWATSIDFADPMKWIEVVLSRAGGAPLSVIYPSISHHLSSDKQNLSQWRYRQLSAILLHYRFIWSGTRDTKKLELARSLFPQSRRFLLLFEYDTDTCWDTGPSTFSAAPHLQELSLAVKPRGYSDLPATSGPSIFDGECSDSPLLKSIYLTTCRFKFLDFKAFPHLTEVIVVGGRSRYSPLQEEECLQMLAHLPQLEILDLDDCFEIGHGTRRNDTPIMLSKLQSIGLRGLQNLSSTFLSRIDFPPSCSMRIYSWGVDDRDVEFYSSMPSDIQKRLQASFQYHKMSEFRVVLAPDADEFLFQNIRHTPEEATIDFSWQFLFLDTTKCIPWFLSILENIPRDFHSLHLHISAFSKEFCLDLIRLFEEVKVLSITDDDTLWTIIKPLTIGHPPDTTFPNLSSLVLDDLSINKTTGLYLEKFFEHRAEMGLPIKGLSIKNCIGRGVKTLVDNLQKLGIQVEWDGRDNWDGYYGYGDEDEDE